MMTAKPRKLALCSKQFGSTVFLLCYLGFLWDVCLFFFWLVELFANELMGIGGTATVNLSY